MRNFIRGIISRMALQSLTKNPPTDIVTLLWTPAHTGVGANEMVNVRARELTDRAAISSTATRDAPAGKPTFCLQYRDIALHYRLLRRLMQSA